MNPTNKTLVERLLSLEPAVIRGVIVAITGAVALVVGHEIDLAWLDAVLAVYAAVSPIVAGLFIRGAVVPTDKVVTYLADVTKPSTLTSGGAVYAADTDAEVLQLNQTSGTSLAGTTFGRHAA